MSTDMKEYVQERLWRGWPSKESMNFRRKISNLKNRDKRCFLKNEQKHPSHKIITEVLISVSLKSRGRGEIDTENIFEKNNVPKLVKHMKSQIQETQWITNRIDAKKSKHRCWNSNCWKPKKKRKRKTFLKAASENHLSYQRTMIGITAEFTSGTTEDGR